MGALWEEVEEEVKLKKMSIMELKDKLSESETERTSQVSHSDSFCTSCWFV